jgi:hypothetical protein
VPLGAVHFLTPLGALAGLVAVVPLASAVLAVRRGHRAVHVLGLRPTGLRRAAVRPGVAALACVLLGLAAAQPVLLSTQTRRVRTHSQVLFVVDVSRSMLASATPSAPTRLQRARDVIARLHPDVEDVPAGLAGLTDRVLPYVFPTAVPTTFDDVLEHSVLVEAPPPQDVSTVATSFDALASVARNGFFGPSATSRTCVLVTDGESAPFSAAGVAEAFGGHGCSLVVVRVGGAGERVYTADGNVEAGYRPDPGAPASVRRLADAVGGSAYEEQQVGRAGNALRRLAERGQTARTSAETSEQRLAPVLAAAALLLVLGLAVSGLGSPRRRSTIEWLG